MWLFAWVVAGFVSFVLRVVSPVAFRTYCADPLFFFFFAFCQTRSMSWSNVRLLFLFSPLARRFDGGLGRGRRVGGAMIEFERCPGPCFSIVFLSSRPFRFFFALRVSS